MGFLTGIQIRNYRSIQEIDLRMPQDVPLVIVGENNVGKSNLCSAVELVLGEFWPGNHDPEDHAFWNRDRSVAIEVVLGLGGVKLNSYNQQVHSLQWMHDKGTTSFMMKVDSKQFRTTSEARDQCFAITVRADRRLNYHMSYSSRWTWLSKLTHQFHKALVSDQHRVDFLKQQFADIKSTFETVREFADFDSELRRQISGFTSQMPYGLEIDFSAYDPSNYFNALKVIPRENGQTRTLDELGTGQEQILAFAFAYAYAKAFHSAKNGLVLILEEPESHLHPLAQQWLGERLRELSRLENVQVILTTHSPAFIDITGLEGLVRLDKQGGATHAVQLTRSQLAEHCRELGASMADPTNILEFYEACSTSEILRGFFASKVVLVEGPTESLALPEYFKKSGLPFIAEGIDVIPVHGKSNLAKWHRLFTAYGIPTYVIFDCDGDINSPENRDILRALNAPIPHPPISNAAINVFPTHAVFPVNFEESFRQLWGRSYDDLEKEAAVLHNSKPLKSRYVASRIDLSTNPESNEILVGLVNAARSVSLPNTRNQEDELPF